ncbi:MAG: hypothetical protein LBK98_02235 [Peptococcaceae bacterium]|jgi:hypothetical protein|nr:hypothetical protein [Peptococcaceae bacterium]
MRRLPGVLLCLLLCGILLAAPGRAGSNKTETRAAERARDFAEAINYHYDEPAGIYDYLTADFKAAMTEAEFVQAFQKERSYPYLVPLFINYRSLSLSEDGESGTAWFSQAARLPGMIYEVPFVYENGDYYMVAFEDFRDGEYLAKFQDIPYSLDMYYNFGDQPD